MLQLVKKKKAQENGILVEKGDTISGLYSDGIPMKVLNILRDASYKLIVSKRNDILGLPRRIIMNSALFQEMLVDFGVLLTLRERKTLELRFCAGMYSSLVLTLTLWILTLRLFNLIFTLINHVTIYCIPSCLLSGPYVHAGNVDFASFKATFLFLGCEMLMGQGNNHKTKNSMSRFVQSEINNEENWKIQPTTTTATTTTTSISTGQETTSIHNNNRHDNNFPVEKSNDQSKNSSKSTKSSPALKIPTKRDDVISALTSRESQEWTGPLYPLPSTTNNITLAPVEPPPRLSPSPSKSRKSLNELLEKKSRDQDEIPTTASPHKRQPRLSLGTIHHPMNNPTLPWFH